MTVTAFVHHKGGVGNTMLLQLLAGELARRGRQVLAVDLDPQANLSRRMGYQESQLENRVTVAEVIKTADPQLLMDRHLPCQWEEDWAQNIRLLPSRLELENRVPEAGIPGSWRRLHLALELARGAFDDVLIDLPPTMGHLFDLACCAADGLLLPTSPTYDGMRGTQRIIDTVNDPERRTALGLHAWIWGVILNGKRSGVADHAERIDQATARWGDLLWGHPITLRQPVASCEERAEPPQRTPGEAGVMIRAAGAAIADRYLADRQASAA
ncbi:MULTISPECIES: ParA family protein [Actinomadura]|uniref:ParA family protein n=1 Tax=Actinomadura yumaensis TaxID=111807 RepID=A0ABW2CWA2_9ACTN|nr:ParA family protein [Actinomadura sp. J1-007]MWK39550.1 AAA family ATPase [Actinomadura sp. J1-007]